MIRITFIAADGRDTELEVPEGWTLMQAATSLGVDGIVGECGGACSCATCHCYPDPARAADLPPVSDAEAEMLGYVVDERRPESRLACQLRATPALDGLIVRLPARQF
jgi:2Fe-2S ferredoxin